MDKDAKVVPAMVEVLVQLRRTVGEAAEEGNGKWAGAAVKDHRRRRCGGDECAGHGGRK